MDEIGRARRHTWVALALSLVMTWVFVAVVSMIEFREGRLEWWRFVPALIAMVGVTWLCARLISPMLDRHCPTRQVVGAAVLAVVGAGAGGAEPFGWGFALVAWLSIATLWISRRMMLVLAFGTFAAGMVLGML